MNLKSPGFESDQQTPVHMESMGEATGPLFARPPFCMNGRVPILYAPEFDVSLTDLKNVHPFNFRKRGQIFEHLERSLPFRRDQIFSPVEAPDEILELVHTEAYVKAVKDPRRVGRIMEMPELAMLEPEVVDRHLLRSLRFGVAGTVMATDLVCNQGFPWAINLSGGFHHAKPRSGEGFCFYNDIAIAAKNLWRIASDLKILVVDLDAHQGNGVASILGADKRVTIFDVFNAALKYPADPGAARLVKYKFAVPPKISDAEYLALLEDNLPKAIEASNPDLIIYNAGADICESDRIGNMAISARGVLLRDQFVFRQAFMHHIPIAMVLSGGYSPDVSNLVGSSITNLVETLMTA